MRSSYKFLICLSNIIIESLSSSPIPMDFTCTQGDTNCVIRFTSFDYTSPNTVSHIIYFLIILFLHQYIFFLLYYFMFNNIFSELYTFIFYTHYRICLFFDFLFFEGVTLQ
eukprot:GHVL01008133.1.p1 GENE.GHVL01008133.1~~GHVL01008133.1.p1  ORF type:complete len:111 (-),score=4.57 GHVL01008133.1:483-815(-)